MARTLSVMTFAMLFASVGASGDTITQTLPYCGTPNFSQFLTFDEFDDGGGMYTLQSIQVLMDMEVCGGALVLDNDGVDPASGTFEFGAKGDISSVDVSLLNASFQPVVAELEAWHSGGFSLDGNVGDGAGDYDPTPPDGMQYNGMTESDSGQGYIASSLFSQYIGTGTYDIEVELNQWSDFGGVSGIEWAVTPATANGEVTVIYDYLVPEPATFGLIAMGGLALLRRRRS